ncbi:MAG: cation diffusion facilitator family transporter [bacterium]
MSHSPSTKNIRTAFFLNLTFTVIEVVGGLLTNSTAILSDAVHDLGDSFALAQAWYFEKKSSRPGKNRYTYGYRRFSVLGGLISTLVILVSSIYVISQAVMRIAQPVTPNPQGMLILAILGIVVNALALRTLRHDQSINARAVALHFLEDVLGWTAILITASLLWIKNIPLLDPILALLISAYMLSRVVKNIRKMLPIFLQAAPEQINLNEIVEKLKNLPQVKQIHHVHLWSLDEQRSVFSAHVVMENDLNPDQYCKIKNDIGKIIDQYDLLHSTVEIEFPEEVCRIAEEEHPSPG